MRCCPAPRPPSPHSGRQSIAPRLIRERLGAGQPLRKKDRIHTVSRLVSQIESCLPHSPLETAGTHKEEKLKWQQPRSRHHPRTEQPQGGAHGLRRATLVPSSWPTTLRGVPASPPVPGGAALVPVAPVAAPAPALPVPAARATVAALPVPVLLVPLWAKGKG